MHLHKWYSMMIAGVMMVGHSHAMHAMTMHNGGKDARNMVIVEGNDGSRIALPAFLVDRCQYLQYERSDEESSSGGLCTKVPFGKKAIIDFLRCYSSGDLVLVTSSEGVIYLENVVPARNYKRTVEALFRDDLNNTLQVIELADALGDDEIVNTGVDVVCDYFLYSCQAGAMKAHDVPEFLAAKLRPKVEQAVKQCWPYWDNYMWDRTCALVAPKNKMICTVSEGRSIYLEFPDQIMCLTDIGLSLEHHGKISLCALGLSNGNLCIYDPQCNTYDLLEPTIRSFVSGVAWCPNALKIAHCRIDGTIGINSIEYCEPGCIYNPGMEFIVDGTPSGITWCNNDTLTVGFLEGTVKLYNAHTGEYIENVYAVDAPVSAVCHDRTGNIIIGDAGGCVGVSNKQLRAAVQITEYSKYGPIIRIEQLPGDRLLVQHERYAYAMRIYNDMSIEIGPEEYVPTRVGFTKEWGGWWHASPNTIGIHAFPFEMIKRLSFVELLEMYNEIKGVDISGNRSVSNTSLCLPPSMVCGPVENTMLKKSIKCCDVIFRRSCLASLCVGAIIFIGTFFSTVGLDVITR